MIRIMITTSLIIQMEKLLSVSTNNLKKFYHFFCCTKAVHCLFSLYVKLARIRYGKFLHLRRTGIYFPGGPGIKTLPSNAEGVGLIPG